MPCNKKTKRCEINPWDKNHLLKSCCRENLMKIILEIPYILQENNWWLDFGTLLGFHRDGKIIDWDSDLDVGILFEDFYKNKLEIENRIKEKGFFLTKVYDNFYRVNFSDKNHLHCDLFLFKKDKEGIYKTCFKEYKSKHNEIFPLNKKVFFGTEFNTPNNIELFLETRYGKNWEAPFKRSDGYKPINRIIKCE
jgi:phosphorylcholine metabolism protein LicD